MGETNFPPQRLARSALAWLAGFTAIVVLSICTDAAMRAAGILPGSGLPPANGALLIAFGYRTIYSIVGSYLVARLAPARPMWHALMLGIVGTIVSAAGAVATWNGGPEYGAKWYPLALIAVGLPCAWLGGKIAGERAMLAHVEEAQSG